jgi:hypothetical protein
MRELEQARRWAEFRAALSAHLICRLDEDLSLGGERTRRLAVRHCRDVCASRIALWTDAHASLDVLRGQTTTPTDAERTN